MHILWCMGLKFGVKLQRAPLKFHTKIWTHTPQNMHFTVLYFCVWVTISFNCDVISLSATGPWPKIRPMTISHIKDHICHVVLNLRKMSYTHTHTYICTEHQYRHDSSKKNKIQNYEPMFGDVFGFWSLLNSVCWSMCPYGVRQSQACPCDNTSPV